MKIKKWLVLGALATATYFGYNSCNKEEILQQKPDNYDPGSFILHMKDGKTLDDVDALRDKDLSYLKSAPYAKKIIHQNIPGSDVDEMWLINPHGVHDKNLDSIMERVSVDDEGDVTSVEYNGILSVMMMDEGKLVQSESASVYGGESCYSRDTECAKGIDRDRLGGKELHYFFKNHSPAKQAYGIVLDTGASDHEDLSSFSNDHKTGMDGHGHSTHVLGIGGADSNNGKGTFSLYPNTKKFLRQSAIKVLDDQGRGTMGGIADAILVAADMRADAINLSLGGPAWAGKKAICKAVKYATDKGVLVFVAAGNSNNSSKSQIPAVCPESIVVSAAVQDFENSQDNLRKCERNKGKNMPERTFFSSYDSHITSYGFCIRSHWPGNKYFDASGTSMATPEAYHIGLGMRAIKPGITREEVISRMTNPKDSLEVKTDKNKKVGRLPLADKVLLRLWNDVNKKK